MTLKRILVLPLLLMLVASAAFAQEEDIVRVQDISVQGNRLSVELDEALFGETMAEISEKAGFELKLEGAIAETLISTRFSDLELQRGIQRLLSLVSQKNYFMYYNTDGNITKIEVFTPSSKAPQMRKTGDVSRSTERRPRRTRKVFLPDLIEPVDGSRDRPRGPFIPPTGEPEYIPPAGKTE